MPFFQVDDQLHVNPKAKALAESVLIDGSLEGPAALGLWTMAGSAVQASLSEGVVSFADLIRILLDPAIALQLASRLVAVGLWHTSGHECTVCPLVEPSTWIFHDWYQMRYKTGKQVRTERKKRAEIQDRELRAAVWARDSAGSPDGMAKCRYCARMLKHADRKSAIKWELDHVDPTKAVGASNLVIACKPCNQKKGNRTPLQAEMTLLPPPAGSSDTDEFSPQWVAGSQDVSNSTGGGSGVVDETTGASSPRRAAGQHLVSPISVLADQSASADPAVFSPHRAAGLQAGSALPETGHQTDGDASEVFSPHRAAGSPQKHSTPPPPRGPAPDVGGLDEHRKKSSSKSKPESKPESIPESRSEAVPRGRAPGQGQGQGITTGLGKGSGQGQPTPTIPKRRRKRRSKGKPTSGPQPPTQAGPDITWDAGTAPDVDVVGTWGSPWYGYRGPFQEAEFMCELHDIPAPCWKCQEGSDL